MIDAEIDDNRSADADSHALRRSSARRRLGVDGLQFARRGDERRTGAARP